MESEEKVVKRIVCGILIVSLLFLMATTAFAETQEVTTGEQDVTTSDNFYQERGQIDLSELEFYLENDDLEIRGADYFSKNGISQEISNSENLNEGIKAMVKEGDEPVAVGYTRIYLKEVQEQDGKVHVEPITVAEASTELKGDKSKKGNLTLYTTAFATKSGITVKSIAQWSKNYYITGENRAAEYDDYISASTSSKYILNSDSFKATMTNGAALASKFYSRQKAGIASSVYSFSEMMPNAFQIKNATLTINCGKNGTLPKTVKSKSKYVHTWGKTNVTISIGTAGVGFTLAKGSKSWQIESFVNCPSK